MNLNVGTSVGYEIIETYPTEALCQAQIEKRSKDWYSSIELDAAVLGITLRPYGSSHIYPIQGKTPSNVLFTARFLCAPESVDLKAFNRKDNSQRVVR